MNPYIWLAGIAFVIACSAGSYRIGKKVERAEFNAYKLDISKQRESNQTAAAREHRQHELALAATDAAFQKARSENEKLRADDRRRALAGELSLRVPSNCVQPAPDATARPGVSNAGATTELPREVTADLFALANDADEIVGQLAACQQVIREDRKEAR